jgi:hypothetical protein
MDRAAEVLTIVPLKGLDGIVDFHDFFVESYWGLRAPQDEEMMESSLYFPFRRTSRWHSSALSP